MRFKALKCKQCDGKVDFDKSVNKGVCSHCGTVFVPEPNQKKKKTSISELLPDFMKNITPRMMIIWAVSFITLLIVGFGTTAIVMVSIPKTYGMSIRMSDVFYIDYRNSSHQKTLFEVGDDLHSRPMNAILNRLASGGRTNQLAHLFRSRPEQIVGNNTANPVQVSTFMTIYSTNSVIIWFKTPRYAVVPIANSNTNFRIVAANGTNDVYGILIPLDNVSNRFQEQTWFLITNNPNRISNIGHLDISYRVTAWGNYSRLWSYIDDLHVKF